VRPLGADEFAAAMARLGPFEPAPRLAVAVSGGADSLALALLADAWARARGGSALGLIIDHGLRAESAGEAATTRDRLAACAVAARVVTLRGLTRGPALAARARAARYAALSAACREIGIVHLLLGHHAGDQAETLLMRQRAGSGVAGLACMPALAETADVRLLRPLLAVPRGRLRATLRALGLQWVEDPSNADPSTLRARLRAHLADPDGTGAATRDACAEAAAHARARADQDRATAAVLARRARVMPLGYAVLTPGGLPPAALAALLRMVAGAAWAPSPDRVAALAARPRPATLGGVRMLPAGRLSRGGWLLAREAAALAPPVPAVDGAVWDGRFRLRVAGGILDGAECGALGADSGRPRAASALPSAVSRTLPAIRAAGAPLAVPHFDARDALLGARYRASFQPAVALAAGVFVPAGDVKSVV
jgi:tRNA(Ile)-lysidine synthase